MARWSAALHQSDRRHAGVVGRHRLEQGASERGKNRRWSLVVGPWLLVVSPWLMVRVTRSVDTAGRTPARRSPTRTARSETSSARCGDAAGIAPSARATA